MDFKIPIFNKNYPWKIRTFLINLLINFSGRISNDVDLMAWKLGYNNPVARVSNIFTQQNLDMKTFNGKPFMVVMNGLCPGSVSLLASNDFQMP